MAKIPIRLSQLLRARQQLNQRADLANSAFAYAQLQAFAERIARANLRGVVTLCSPDPEEDEPCASLTALEGNQSVIEEHFSDEDLLDLTDIVGHVTDSDEVEVTFHIEDFAETFVAPLRAALAQAGVVMDDASTPQQHPAGDAS